MVKGEMEKTIVRPVGIEKKIVEWRWKVIKRHFNLDHEFFEEGDQYLKLSSRYLPSVENIQKIQSKTEFPCGHARCPMTFNSLMKYETHYNLSHRNVCGTCQRIFPSAHLLDIHILESHDVMFSLLAQKTKMYQCLIESCTEKFCDGRERQQHLIKQHHYPANFRYRHAQGSSKSRKCKTEKTLSSRTSDDGMEIETIPVLCPSAQNTKNSDTPKSNLLEAKFKPRVPTNICFGQGVGRGFQRQKKPYKHWHNQKKGNKKTTVDIENMDLKDMSEALTDS